MSDVELQSKLRELPSVSLILLHGSFAAVKCSCAESVIVQHIRLVLERLRAELVNGTLTSCPPLEDISKLVISSLQSVLSISLKSVINATGIVLHTGLGRARLSQSAAEAVYDVARNHSLLELDSETGARGSRQSHVEKLLCELTGSEAALVVNNCAAALLLVLTALARGGEVIISRGELVEIGGSFRVPDILAASGAILVEVGTTNKTRISDYRDAISEKTSLILRCHPSNFEIVGFTEKVSNAELAALAKQNGLPYLVDQGSGCLLADQVTSRHDDSATIQMCNEAGADLVTASGDKLLGGPQAGLIFGQADLVQQVARHPITRALRPDKLLLAALEATLRLYLNSANAIVEIPTARYLSRLPNIMKEMADGMISNLNNKMPPFVSLCAEPCESQVGGGAMTGQNLPSYCVSIRSSEAQFNANNLMALLRKYDPPIIARIQNDRVLFDMRTVEMDECKTIEDALVSIFI